VDESGISAYKLRVFEKEKKEKKAWISAGRQRLAPTSAIWVVQKIMAMAETRKKGQSKWTNA